MSVCIINTNNNNSTTVRYRQNQTIESIGFWKSTLLLETWLDKLVKSYSYFADKESDRHIHDEAKAVAVVWLDIVLQLHMPICRQSWRWRACDRQIEQLAEELEMINKEGKMCKHGTSSRQDRIRTWSLRRSTPSARSLTFWLLAICMYNRGFMEDLERGGMPLSSEKVADMFYQLLAGIWYRQGGVRKPTPPIPDN